MSAGLGFKPDPRLLDAGQSPWGWHRLESFMLCPRRYGLDRIIENAGLGAWTTSSQAQATGSLVHVALAHHYARMRLTQSGQDPNALYPSDMAIRVTAERSGWLDYVENAERVYTAYAHHYRYEKPTVLHVEEVFHLQVDPDTPPITLRFDLVTEEQGLVYIVDHKTAGRITADHPRFYSYSGQFLAMRWIGALTWGQRFGGVRLNLIQTSAPDFRRPPMAANPALYASFPESVRWFRRLVSLLESSALPYHEWPAVPSEFSCWGRYGPCRHTAGCAWGEKLPADA